MCADVLDPIRKRIQSGDIEGARSALFRYLREKPHYIPGWMLLAGLLSDPKKQADCYRQVLRLDPAHSQAAARLNEIDEGQMIGSQNELRMGEEIGAQPMIDCPNCGAHLSISLTDTSPQRVVCDYCQTEVKLPEKEITDKLGQDVSWTEHVLGVKGSAPALENIVQEPERVMPEELRQLVQMLRTQGPDILDAETIRNLEARGIAVQVTEDEVVITSEYRRVAVHRSEMPSDLRHLSFQHIVGMAGKPLATTERRRCPKCDAVIDAQATRCPWCSTSLSPEG
jgi:hypothetical protein